MSKIHEALKRAAAGSGESNSGSDAPLEDKGRPVEEPLATADEASRPVRPERSSTVTVAEEAAGTPAPRDGTRLGLDFQRLRAFRLDPLPGLVTASEPKSLSAEQFRTLRTRIQRLSTDSPRRLLLVTSPGPGEGKTMVSVNLAMSMSQEVDSRVLLVDCDLRRPNVHRLLGMASNEHPGLTECLTGQVPLEKAIWRYGGSKSLYVLTAGSIPDNPSELLGSKRMGEILEFLAGQFDQVVLDAPPLNPVADPAILIPAADGVLAVVRYGQTGRASLCKALEDIPEEKLLGLVFNAAELRFSRYYYTYDYAEEK